MVLISSKKEATRCFWFNFISSHCRLKPLISRERMERSLWQHRAALVFCDNGQLVRRNRPHLRTKGDRCLSVSLGFICILDLICNQGSSNSNQEKCCSCVSWQNAETDFNIFHLFIHLRITISWVSVQGKSITSNPPNPLALTLITVTVGKHVSFSIT